MKSHRSVRDSSNVQRESINLELSQDITSYPRSFCNLIAMENASADTERAEENSEDVKTPAGVESERRL
jgi:hypothetical protein